MAGAVLWTLRRGLGSCFGANTAGDAAVYCHKQRDSCGLLSCLRKKMEEVFNTDQFPATEAAAWFFTPNSEKGKKGVKWHDQCMTRDLRLARTLNYLVKFATHIQPTLQLCSCVISMMSMIIVSMMS